MLHLLPCLKTFHIVGYINERALNKRCGVPSICNSLHVELHLICRIVCALCHAMLFKPDMHHTCLCIMPCLCLCIYHVVCFFPVLLLSSVMLRSWGFVHLRPFVFFMDSFFFLAGFQARWPYPRNHFYLCLLVASVYRYAALPITCLPCLPYCHVSL